MFFEPVPFCIRGLVFDLSEMCFSGCLRTLFTSRSNSVRAVNYLGVETGLASESF